MLTERSRNKALEAFLKGQKVIVMTVFDDGSIAADKLEDILLTGDSHYLVDVPAVENPEFKQAVSDMVQSGQKQEEPAEEKNSTPPNGAGGERDASGRKDEERDCTAAGRAGDESSGDCKENRRKI